MSAPAPLMVGEPFNPWRGACGFYPPDVVSEIRAVVILQTRRKLAANHKQLYTHLVRRWGREGPCYPRQERLARDLGCSVRSIRMCVEDLEAFGLIARRGRGRGKGGDGQSDEYSFLWHPVFDRQNSAIMTGKNEDCDRQEPSVLTGKDGRYDRQESTLLTGKLGHPLYKEEARTAETRTASKPACSLPPPTITNEYGRVDPNPEFRRIRGILENAEPRIRRARNPEAYRRAILQLELADEVAPLENPSADGSGDVAGGPDRQTSGAAEEAQHVPSAPAETSPPESNTGRCITAEVATSKLPGRRCVECEGSGMRQAAGDSVLWEWCECETGAQKRAEAPGAVDAANALVFKLRSRFVSPTRSPDGADDRPRSRLHRSGGIQRKGLTLARDLVPAELLAAGRRKA